MALPNEETTPPAATVVVVEGTQPKDEEQNKDKAPTDDEKKDAPKKKKDDGDDSTDGDDDDDGDEKKKLDESLQILIGSDTTLTEEFKSKAAVLFEAAMAEKTAKIRATLTEEFNVRTQEQIASLKKSLEEQVDDYASCIVEGWITERSKELDSALKTELSEGFITGLKTLFKEHYIDVPEDQRDTLGKLKEQLNEAKEDATLIADEVFSLQEQITALKREKILTEQSAGLASTQSARLRTILEEIEFESEEAFSAKVKTIKESVFRPQSQTLTEETQTPAPEAKKIDPRMKDYVKALERI